MQSGNTRLYYNSCLACIFTLILVALTACGFQLRGTQSPTAPRIAKLNLRSISADDLTREIKSQLQLAGITTAADADYTLTLAHENYQRSVLSVSPRTGKAEEFQLTLSARMTISKKGAKDLVSNAPVSASRDYLFDEDALLGKTSEEKELKENLRRQVATSIILRLNATIDNQ